MFDILRWKFFLFTLLSFFPLCTPHNVRIRIPLEPVVTDVLSKYDEILLPIRYFENCGYEKAVLSHHMQPNYGVYRDHYDFGLFVKADMKDQFPHTSGNSWVLLVNVSHYPHPNHTKFLFVRNLKNHYLFRGILWSWQKHSKDNLLNKHKDRIDYKGC